MVHLEPTNGLTTDEFLQAFSRMKNRRKLCQGSQRMQKPSKPQVEELRSRITSQSHRASRCWTFWIKIESSLSYQLKGLSGDSSHERLPGEVDGGKDFVEQLKNHCTLLGRALFPLIKIEGVINSRPLIAVNDDNRDPLPITPVHLAINRSLKSNSPGK